MENAINNRVSIKMEEILLSCEKEDIVLLIDIMSVLNEGFLV